MLRPLVALSSLWGKALKRLPLHHTLNFKHRQPLFILMQMFWMGCCTVLMASQWQSWLSSPHWVIQLPLKKVVSPYMLMRLQLTGSLNVSLPNVLLCRVTSVFIHKMLVSFCADNHDCDSWQWAKISLSLPLTVKHTLNVALKCFALTHFYIWHTWQLWTGYTVLRFMFYS